MFKTILIILMFVNYVNASVQIVLKSDVKKNITDGEIVKVYSEAVEHFKAIESYKNKRITSAYFVLNVTLENQRVLVDLIAAQAKPDEKIEKKDLEFIVEGLDYRPQKSMNIQDFIVLDFPIDLKKVSLIKLSLMILSFLLIIYLFFRLKRIKNKGDLKKQKLAFQLFELLSNASKRSDYTLIYEKRKVIKELIELDNEIFDKSLVILDQFQYQRDWPENLVEDFEKLFKRSKQNMRIKNGI